MCATAYVISSLDVVLASAAEYIGNALYRKFETNIPRKKTARPRSQFLNYLSVHDLYIPTTGLLTPNSKIGGPIVGIYKSLTDT
jgi:hypothetical protein